MIEFYEARRDTRWDVYPQAEPVQSVAVEWAGKIATIRHLPHGNEARTGQILVRLVGALF
jgi:hypothetical protein